MEKHAKYIHSNNTHQKRIKPNQLEIDIEDETEDEYSRISFDEKTKEIEQGGAKL